VAKRIAATGGEAVAYAVRDMDVDVIAAYPITPQTVIAEKLADLIADGELDAEMIHVESEHSALSASVAASLAGARVFTATASQGLELMHEILFIASGLRAPLVMALATRALSAPISIWNDYGDLASARDTGWIILVSENVQEAYDNVVQAYRIAENPDVLLPVMVALDGFILSHTVEPLEMIPREELAEYAPKRPYGYRPVLNPEKPLTMGTLADPKWYYEVKRQQVEALRNAAKYVEEAGKEFGRRFGREYGFIEEYMMDDADYAIVVMGAVSGTVKAAAKRLREKGVKAGVVKVRMYRPFPADTIARALENVKAVGVLDKAILFGSTLEGPLAMDVAATLYTRGLDKPFISFIHGIGGRDVYVADVVKMYEKLAEAAEKGEKTPKTIYFGVRE